MPQSQPQGSFGIQLQGYNVLKELPRSSSRTRTYRIRPRLHDDLPRYMASEETCYVLKCISVTGAGHKPKSRGAANESQVLREMSALVKLRHSNLVPCHKVFLQDGRVCTMMGSMDTGSLQDVIAGLNKGLDGFEDFKDLSAPAGAVRFEPRLIWHFLIQALEGLERVHRCSIIHRALKPSNLLLEPETCYTHTDFRWRLKISDVAVPELLRRDNSKIPATKLRYMAPELLTASSPYDSKVRTARIARLSPLTPPPPAINPRAAEALAVPPNPMPMRASSPPPPRAFNQTDMWAIGCTLFEMLALRRAFQTAGDIASRTLSPLPADADGGLVALLEQLLSLDAEDRPSAAETLALPSVAERYADWPFAGWLIDGGSCDPTAEIEPVRYDANSDKTQKCWAQHPADGLWYLGQITSAISTTPADCFLVHFAELDDNALCWHDSIKPFRQAPSAGRNRSAPRSPATLKSGVVVGFGKTDVVKVRVPVPLEDALSSIPDDFDSDKSDTEDCGASGGTSKRGGLSGLAPRISMLGRLLPSPFTDGGESITGIATWSGRTNQRSVGEELALWRRAAPSSTAPPAPKIRPNSAPAVSERKTPEPSRREASRRYDDSQSIATFKPFGQASTRSANAGSVVTREAADMREQRKKSSACAIL